jgi:hypothetical protein
MTVNPLIGGLLSAGGVCVISFAVAEGAQKSTRRAGQSAVAESMVGTAVRIVLTVLGVAGVCVVFGRSYGIVCAVGTIPLYIVELVGSVVLLIRRLDGGTVKNETGQPDSESNQ